MASRYFGSLTKNKLWVNAVILLAVCLLVAAIYLGAANRTYRLGFPLDDAWIHQTFAKNLLLDRQWSYNQGELTSGSTSPLWTGLLALGNLMAVNNLWWSYSLGVLLLFLTGFFSEILVRRLIKEYAPFMPWVGILVCSEWHLAWAALSGMEILLSCTVLLIIILLTVAERPNWFLVGLFLGIGLWVRPDALIWFGFILWWMVFGNARVSTKIKAAFHLLIGFAPEFGLYTAFNLYLSDRIFPNTMIAKQSEYLELSQYSLPYNFVRLASQLLIGIGIVLLPALVYKIYSDIKAKKWRNLGFIVLILGFICVYAWKLPVTYQYGRYLMPLIPIYIVYASFGLISARDQLLKSGKPAARIKFAYLSTLAIMLVAFFVIGCNRYSLDVATIESEMVDTARWIQRFIAKNEIVAAHDIGALGYFGEHKIIDLAGLITPEIVPFIRDEILIMDYINQSGAGYLMTFENWYPRIDALDLPVVYQSKLNYAINQGQGRMVVYRILP